MGRAHEVRAASMAKTAAMKSSKYAKWGKEIFQAAKAGVPDPEMNQGLKRTIERAKKDQCPADVIKRAIEKAKGVNSGATREKVYEGMGPGNVAVIVECLTDNDNRTFTEVRTAFNKTGGNIGQAVSYLFSRKAQFVFEGMTEDEAMEALMNAEKDFEDLSTDEDGFVQILADPSDFEDIKNALLEAKPELEFETCSVENIPSSYVDLDEDHEAKFRRLLSLLREYDDVSEIYHNANIDEDEDEE
ncbi:MAG: YebC/PmpR family DNA-binding transcriptional regulator [Acholeplasmatales bacterium]|nr:YebC/PmpR family DNA-binding transcriptional regulator [Acholeplasmatales bacterium]